ncbi:hypothetical protein EOD42_14440 [Rhodovarius crocodyli]|uniref:Uncharacterized protein n=1 Tax=Rhodovarius crocodyli TaxID=1979269 RepID=A0A437MFA6_9PROT|nr:hypothetical protein [Rhodovarius crocodyli]RVT96306.1 hypothetical protein EOD42_14440 [Rhodovarius crocodyli]
MAAAGRRAASPDAPTSPVVLLFQRAAETMRRPSTCQFPLWGDEERPEKREFCGKPLRPIEAGGGPYCPACARRCYTVRAFITLPKLRDYRQVTAESGPIGVDGKKENA